MSWMIYDAANQVTVCLLVNLGLHPKHISQLCEIAIDREITLAELMRDVTTTYAELEVVALGGGGLESEA